MMSLRCGTARASSAFGPFILSLALAAMLADPGAALGAPSRSPGAIGATVAMGPLLTGLRSDPEDTLRRFAERQLAGAWFTPGRDSLELGPWTRAGEVRVARLSQWHRSHRVLGAQVRVVLDANDRVRLVNGRFLADLDSPAAPSVSQVRARAVAFGALAMDPAGWRVECGLAAARLGSGDHLVWVVRIEDARGGRAWRVLVDAVGGSVLLVDDLACHAPALVYPSDPRAPLEERPLGGFAGDSTRLEHVKFSVENRAFEQLVVPDHDFRFPDGHPLALRRPEVNAYWHAQRFLDDFLGAAGYPGPPEPFVLRVEERLEPYAAITSGRFVLLGAPIDGLTHDAALSDDILDHELQHAVTYGFGVGATGTRREALALHEGLSDFMAASSTDDPSIGEWLYLSFPGGVTRVDRPASTFCYSNYDRVAFGGVSVGSGWANGMILSGALWDLRAIIGPVTERLVLRALAFLPESPEWAHFVNAMVEADLQMFAGAHAAQIVQAFATREIRGSLAVTIAGPASSAPGAATAFQANVEGVTTQAISWSVRRYCGNVPCGDWEEVGTGTAITLTEETDYELRASVVGLLGIAEDIRFIDVLSPTLALAGPPAVGQGEVHTYTAQAGGVGPLGYDWWRTFSQSGAIRERIGSGAAVSVRADAPYALECRITDALGRRVTRSLTVPFLSVSIEAPARATPGEAVWLRALGTAPLDSLALQWRAIPYCGVAPCDRDTIALGTERELSRTFSTDMLVMLTAIAPWGSRATATFTLNVLWPRVRVLGPGVMSPRETGTFVAGIEGVGPFDVRWWRQDIASAARTEAGTGSFLQLRQPQDFDLVVRVRDGLGREEEAVRRIGIADVVDGEGGVPRFALELASIATGCVPLRFHLAQAAAASVRVLDVSGREVARLWDGAHAAGSQELRWDPAGSREGIYFVRLESLGQRITRRVALLR